MLALTIWRPWTNAICHPSPKAKRTENRSWAAPWVRNKRIAIHAGARYDDEDAVDFIEMILGETPPDRHTCPQGIVATAKVAGFRRHDSLFTPADDPWLVGPVGWQLEDVVVLPEPIACKGAQGLWQVPPGVLVELLGREAAARAARGG